MSKCNRHLLKDSSTSRVLTSAPPDWSAARLNHLVPPVRGWTSWPGQRGRCARHDTPSSTGERSQQLSKDPLKQGQNHFYTPFQVNTAHRELKATIWNILSASSIQPSLPLSARLQLHFTIYTLLYICAPLRHWLDIDINTRYKQRTEI